VNGAILTFAKKKSTSRTWSFIGNLALKIYLTICCENCLFRARGAAYAPSQFPNSFNSWF
jgi:hypothetical protein